MKEKIYIFLDIDGVLNNVNSGIDKYGNDLNPKNIKNFIKFKKELAEKFLIRIILSSDWKYLDDYDIILSNYGITIDDTTKLTLGGKKIDNSKLLLFNNLEKLRIKEINDYIKHNKIKNYVVIDDMNLEGMDNFYKTNPRIGFTGNEKKICN